MKRIIVVSAISTGFNYVWDILRRGYEPIVLETRFHGSEEVIATITALREQTYRKLPEHTAILKEQDSYEQTLALVKEQEPILILAGSEDGVPLASRLSTDMHLPGLPYDKIDQYTKKSAMHEALIRAGLRGIRGRVTKSFAEAEEFMKELGTENVVVKPIRSAGSMGVRLCSCKEDVKKAFDDLLQSASLFGETLDEVLVQERIFGTEYIVNTISRNGKHKVTSIWKYDKIKTEKGGYIYNNNELIDGLDLGGTEMVEYAYSVLDALEVKDGPVHGEFMVDKKGPVLIEVNCRPMGCSLPAGFADFAYGHHETNVILDSMLDEDYFDEFRRTRYVINHKAYMKMLITPKDITVTASPLHRIVKHMKNVYSYDLVETDSAVKLAKTEDLETSCGVIFITGEDDRETQLEVQLLHQLEDRYFRTLYHGVGEKETPLLQDTASCVDILNMTHARGSILVVSDRDNTDCHAVCVRPQDLGSAMDSYDNVLFDGSFYGEGHEVEETVEKIFDAMKKVRVGGRFIVSENFYQRIPYGRTFIDALMMIGGFRILAPDSTQKHVVMGFRKPEGEPDGKQSA